MTDLAGLLRKDINKINAYIPGKPIDLVKRQLGINNIIKLASNENAYGVSRKAKRAIIKSLGEIFRYPDGSCYYLKLALAKKLKIKPENLIFGNGSDELIDIIIKTFLNPTEEILTAKTTFVEYEILALANGFKAKTIPLRNFRYDLEKMRESISRKTKVIFISNPNNPTGTYITKEEFNKFIESIPKNTLVVVDEAYNEFVTAKDFPMTMPLIGRKNIIILRTFSKAYGLAGLRIGYAIARKEFIQAMERLRQPFNVNLLAQKAAEAILTDSSYLYKTKKNIISQREKMYSEFESLGIDYIPSQANFIMFRTKLDGEKLCQILLRKGIIIRDLKPYNLNKYVRVTIGTAEENKRFIKELKRILETNNSKKEISKIGG